MDLAQQLAFYADRVRDIAAFGLHYSENRRFLTFAGNGEHFLHVVVYRLPVPDHQRLLLAVFCSATPKIS